VEILGKIGEGTYGVVFKCKIVNSGEVVALKRSKVPRGEEPTVTPSAIREIKLLRELCHMQSPFKKRIVDLMDVYVDKQYRLNLMYRYVELDLDEIIRYHKQERLPISAVVVKSVVWQVLEGVRFLHDNWVIHRDLKPSNILVARGDATRDKGQVKIADFGMSRLFQDPFVRFDKVDQVVVTSFYRAPELLMGSVHYNCAIDLWAVGCIFAEIVIRAPIFQTKAPPAEKPKNGGIPFEKEQVTLIFEKLGPPKISEWAELDQLPNWPEAQMLSMQGSGEKLMIQLTQNELHEQGGYLVMRFLEYNPNARITAADALDHSYFKEKPLPLENNVFEEEMKKKQKGEKHTILYPTRPVLPVKPEDTDDAPRAPKRGREKTGPHSGANKTGRY